MKIKKFRIWNYKSIKDSQDCYFSQKVTILAGKNESGKTSILEALEDFNANRDIREKAIPIQDDEAKPKIAVWFACTKDEINEIFQIINHAKEIKSDTSVVCLEKHYPNTFTLGEETIKDFGFEGLNSIDATSIDNEVTEPLEKIAAIFNAHPTELQNLIPPQMNTNELEPTKVEFEKFKTVIESRASTIPEPDSTALIESIDKVVNSLRNALDNASMTVRFIVEFRKRYPNFILFSSFNDIFPNTIPMEDLDKNEWIRDLGIMSDLRVETIKSDNDRKKREHKTKVNIQINEDFKKFWDQDLAELSIDWDTEKLNFWIEENGHSYEPEIRSQGKRWYMAFYIKVTARSKDKSKNIILIDEPGLYLHATAQKDVLKKLESASDDAQVVFSTHSPYLIEADKLERIRLVYKNNETGTIIENKIHKVADKETLTPILTAIGLEMASSISQIDRIKNVVVEGPSDYYFLQSFKRLFNSTDINYIFGGGAGNMPKVGTILQGWGCQVIYLYDSDQGLKDALKNIKEEWVTTTQELISKIPVEGSIEDIFSKKDYKDLVLKSDVKLGKIEKNSKYAKSAKRDKVLDAKLFLESLSDSITLDPTSSANAKKLLQEIGNKFTN